MHIINIVHADGETFDFSKLPKEKQDEIADKIAEQFFLAIGYKKVKTKDKTA